MSRVSQVAHEGVPLATVELRDPSHENFCRIVTGSSTSSPTPPLAACQLVDILNVVPLATCQSEFCVSGTDGYYEFVAELVNAVVSSAGYIGGGFVVAFLFSLTMFINLCYLHSKARTGASAAGKVLSDKKRDMDAIARV